MANQKRPVLVTLKEDERACRFAGLLVFQSGDTIVLEGARCLWFGGGAGTVAEVFGAAARGPGESCDISPCVARCELHGVEIVVDMSATAVKAIETLEAERKAAEGRPVPTAGPKMVTKV